MKHKFLITMMAAIMLTSGIGTAVSVNNTQPVQAISKCSWHYHWVTVTRPTTVYRVKLRGSIANSRTIPVATLYRGEKIQVKYPEHEFPWFIRGHGFHGVRVVLRQKANWFRNGR